MGCLDGQPEPAQAAEGASLAESGYLTCPNIQLILAQSSDDTPVTDHVI